MSLFLSCYERVGDKFVKKTAHFSGAPVHAFRMPLDAQGTGMGFQLNGLDGAVLGTRADRDSAARRVDRLMMKTVHIQAASCVLPEKRSPLRADPVAHLSA